MAKSILKDNATTGFRELGRFDGWNWSPVLGSDDWVDGDAIAEGYVGF